VDRTIEPERVELTRRISAPASSIFTVITDPRGHVAIDGSGMLIAAPEARAITGVGDMFVIDMDREPLGHLPMGKYQIENLVTAFQTDRELAWAAGGVGRKPFGHIYGSRLDPVSDAETEVLHYCDWSGVPEEAEARGQGRWPIVPLEMLVTTLENLDRIESHLNRIGRLIGRATRRIIDLS
jgi:hypothetical protein